MASENIKKAILKKKIGDVLYELLVKTSADLVEVEENKTLTEKLSELNTQISGKATSSDITKAINNLINSAPGTYDTLGEIATWIQSHETEFEGLQAIAGKVMEGATSDTAGKSGTVPAPQTKDKDKFLKGDGTWATPTNTTYNEATTTQAGLMSANDKKKLDGLKNYDDSTIKADIAKKARVILSSTEPGDLTENDLFLEEITD